MMSCPGGRGLRRSGRGCQGQPGIERDRQGVGVGGGTQRPTAQPRAVAGPATERQHYTSARLHCLILVAFCVHSLSAQAWACMVGMVLQLLGTSTVLACP